MESIAQLKMSIAEFKTRIEFLEKAIDEKDELISTLKAKNTILKEQLGIKD